MVQSEEDLLCAEAPALLAGSNCAACSRGSQETVITAAFVEPLAQHNDQIGSTSTTPSTAVPAAGEGCGCGDGKPAGQASMPCQ